MTQLLLIRHARNDWVGDRLAGWTPGVHLNDEGRGEAEALARRLKDYTIDAVYSSPLERATETAAFLAKPRGLEVQVLPGIGEVRFGTWAGHKLKELAKEELWARAQVYPGGTRFPEGENLAEVQARALAALAGVLAAWPDGVVAAVSHGDVIKAVVAQYVGTHLDLFQRLVVSTASLTVVRFTPHGPRLLLFNDVGTIPRPPKLPSSGDEAEDAKH